MFKTIKLLQIVFMVPPLVLAVTAITFFLFGCSVSEAEMIAHCRISFFEPFAKLLGGLGLISAFSGPIWLPGLFILLALEKNFKKRVSTISSQEPTLK